MEPTGAAFELKLDELTKSFGENSEFWNQFAGSGVAHVFMMLGVGLFYGIRRLCERDSKCKSHLHCCCIDVDVSDRTLHSKPERTDEPGPGFV